MVSLITFLRIFIQPFAFVIRETQYKSKYFSMVNRHPNFRFNVPKFRLLNVPVFNEIPSISLYDLFPNKTEKEYD